jgi:hypothetical protein
MQVLGGAPMCCVVLGRHHELPVRAQHLRSQNEPRRMASLVHEIETSAQELKALRNDNDSLA